MTALLNGRTPTNLTYEGLLNIWHNSTETTQGERLEQIYQNDLFYRKDWEKMYGVWGPEIGEQLPAGLMIGSWDIRRFNGDGIETGAWRSAKIITTVGKTALANYLATATPTTTPFMKYLGIGTGSTAAAVGDTALGGGTGSPITEVRGAASGQRLLGTGSNTTNVYQQTATSVAGNINGGTTVTIAEAGMFDNISIQTVAGTPSGTMYDRTVLSATAVITSADTLQLTFQITFS